MTTEFTTEWARRIRVIPNDQRMLLAVSTLDGSDEIRANLSKDEAKTLAAALDPDAGKWLKATEGVLDVERAQHDETRRALADVETERNRYRDQVRQVGRELSLLGDEADRLREHVEERGERVDALRIERDDTKRALADVEGRAVAISIDRDVWRERAENGEPRPEVSRDELAEVIRRGWGNGEFGSPHGVLDAVWRYLHPEPEPEAAVDPVEALAEELFKVGHPEFALDWSNVLEHTRDVYRRMARHTIERKADQ